MIQDFPTGIGNYRESLIRALAKLPPDHSFILVGNSGNKMEGWVVNQPQFEFISVLSKPNSIHQHVLLPLELVPLKLDLFWTMPWGVSVFLWQKYALTIYDLLYRHYPEIASLKARLYEGLVSKWVARRAEIIFTISEFVKDDIEGFLGIKKDKIVNIRGAASNAYQPLAKRLDKGLTRIAGQTLTEPFFVYLGNFRPHKNLKTLLQAFANVKKQISRPEDGRPLAENAKLVLIGDVDAQGRSGDSAELLKTLKELKLQDDIVLTGRIPDDREVAAILNDAVALVHPSFHEGFGLTILEAMSCGCPVIAANTTSIPEVGGDAVIYVDPFDAESIASAMDEILHSNTAQYQSRVQKGIEQEKKFSWQKTAEKVLDVISNT